MIRMTMNSRAILVILNGTQCSEGSGPSMGQTYHPQARSFAFGSG
jgi:hypothetical protein